MPEPPPLGGGSSAGMIEQSVFGPLPRVSGDGQKPREAYARPSNTAAGVPKVVIVVGGLGLSQTGTQSAIEQLPEDVTLAFAPYGASLQRWVDKARGEGHEVLLQVPLEPNGYPDQNPGEHTLLVSSDGTTAQNDLHWALARMTSYAGVMNYMGGRFTADENAMVPFIGEIGERGLFYLDDGTSGTSLAPAIGQGLRVPVLTADLVVDRVRSADAVEQQLDTLAEMAKNRGIAIGVASAFPTSVEVIANWAREAPGRGIAIVPASAAAHP
jgi:polysaccharide deacetylase 2 family uncharacterized protein YibQ